MPVFVARERYQWSLNGRLALRNFEIPRRAGLVSPTLHAAMQQINIIGSIQKFNRRLGCAGDLYRMT
jgi:hypothetical protein